jgi:guanine nucleotide-exchange factor
MFVESKLGTINSSTWVVIYMQLAANVYMSLLQRFRETLKVELGIFFSLILLRSVDVTETPLPQCSTVLK